MKTAVLICPGRGTYTKTELGSLAKFPDRALLARFDAERARLGQETLTVLDGAQAYSVARHSRGDNASALIYACTLGDSLSLAGVEVVAVTGNSMGWYSALACAGALSPMDGFTVVNTMGTLMQEALIGGQLVYPFMGEGWQGAPARRAAASVRWDMRTGCPWFRAASRCGWAITRPSIPPCRPRLRPRVGRRCRKVFSPNPRNP